MPVPRTILFLGAGASTPFDFPTTAQFKSRLSKELSDDTRDNRLLKYVLNRNELTDIEDVLTTFDELASLESIPSALDFLSTIWPTLTQTNEGNLVPNKNLVPLVKDLRERVRDAVFEYYQPNPARDQDIQHLYALVLEKLFRFKVDLSKTQAQVSGTAVVVTTNYDPVIERFCLHLKGGDLRDGFDGDPNNQKGKWNPSWSFGPIAPFSDERLYLLKLHGSLNWRKQRVTEEITRVPISERVPRHSGEYLDNVLLYPGSKGPPREEPFVKLFALFEALLKETYTLVVVGYRFRDPTINQMLLQFLQDGKKALYVLSRHAVDDVKQNLKPPDNLLDKRVLAKNLDFGPKNQEFLQFIEDARSRSEG